MFTSNTARLAGFPSSMPLSMPKRRAGAVLMSSASRSRPIMPGSTSPVQSTGKAVSSPVMPKALFSSPRDFSSAECGAWSVAIMSMVPSRSASISARRSASPRSGGFILKRPSSWSSASESSR